ncbi:MAG: hypothetical protein JST85_08805 [Acidobacteria bacterium]|nr:hypothetical protein [Acidobacteriota bacterium]
MNLPDPNLANYPLLDSLLYRRSRRFGLGMKMDGPLAYQSQLQPMPLTEDEEALLVFAATGITGYALAELVYTPGKGDIMTHLPARTTASGDGAQSVIIFVINDTGTYMVRRPMDMTFDEVKTLIELTDNGQFTEAYRLMRVKLKDERSAPPLDPMYNLDCNRWSVYQPGTTYFLPVNDLSFVHINGLLNIFGPTMGAYVLDERHNFRPAGLKQFARSNGGHLNDDPEAHEISTINFIETGTAELVAYEQGMMCQNMALMAQAMGIGGFPNFAVHLFGWFQALGFNMGQMSTSEFFGKGMLVDFVAHLLKRDLPIPYPLGLELNGQTLLKAHCPPYFPTMREAVMDVVNTKFGPQGTFRSGITSSAWSDPTLISSSLPDLSEKAVEATVSYCEYIYETYGRFPATTTAYHTVLGFQAGHLDVDFYKKYYKPEALSETHREHMARWHGEQSQHS